MAVEYGLARYEEKKEEDLRGGEMEAEAVTCMCLDSRSHCGAPKGRSQNKEVKEE